MGWGALWLKLKGDTTRQILINGRPAPMKIPVVDAKLKRLAGYPSRTASVISDKTVTLVRRAVNTRAFEYVVTGLCNPHSELRSYFKKPTTIRLL